jgi:cation transport ATPase
MLTIFDTEGPLSDEDMLEVRQYASERIAAWRRRSLYSTMALVLTCVVIYPFLAGHALHSYWESFGKYLIFVAMALLVVFVLCTGFFYSAWQALRDVEKGQG